MRTLRLKKSFRASRSFAGEPPAVPVRALLTQALVVMIGAFLLKQHYSTASVNELRWILAPTAWLVQLITGQVFAFELHAGYMSSDHTFLIGVSCAGVNFLITAFLMLSLRQLWVTRSAKGSWKYIPIAAIVAYVATLIANAFRIMVALQMRSFDSTSLTRNELHRFEGIVVYFGFLLLLFIASERLISKSTSDRGPELVDLRGLFIKASFPLLVYYATTLALPLANALYRGGVAEGFGKHFAVVVIIPLLFVISVTVYQLFRSTRTL